MWTLDVVNIRHPCYYVSYLQSVMYSLYVFGVSLNNTITQLELGEVGVHEIYIFQILKLVYPKLSSGSSGYVTGFFYRNFLKRTTPYLTQSDSKKKKKKKFDIELDIKNQRLL